MPRSRGPRASARPVWRGAALCGTVALLALGCAGKSEPPATTKGKPAKTAKAAKKAKLPKSEGNCINPRSVSNFRVLDRNRVLVDTYPQRVIELYEGCDGLRFMDELTFAGSGGGIICDYRNDALIVEGRRCSIASIRDYEADADANLRKEIEGQKTDEDEAPKKDKAPAPEKTPR